MADSNLDSNLADYMLLMDFAFPPDSPSMDPNKRSLRELKKDPSGSKYTCFDCYELRQNVPLWGLEDSISQNVFHEDGDINSQISRNICSRQSLIEKGAGG